MSRPESIALELLAYKVAEYVRGGEPSGGSGSMWRLLEHVRGQTEKLDPAQRRQLDALAEQLDEHERSKSKTGTDTLESLILGMADEPERDVFDTDPTDVLVLEALENAPAPVAQEPEPDVHETDEIRREREILHRIAQRAWWDDIEDFVQRTAASWRADRERAMARLAFATLQNLEKYSQTDGFAEDTNLRRFQVTVPLPERDDPLVSFSDPESLAEIARNLVEAILSVRDEKGLLADVDLPAAGAFQYVREAAVKVSQDPYAGRLSVMSSKGPSSDQLRLAIRELSKERLSEQHKTAQRKHLEQRLAETLAHERSQRQMFQRDVHRFGELVHGYFERLADQLPPDVGGKGAGPQLPGAVLFGEHPASRVERVPAGADAITVRLLGPLRFTLGGIDIAVTGTGESRGLFVGEEELRLGEHMKLHIDGARVSTYQVEDYLHVRVHDRNRSLASLMAEALVVFYVLSQAERENMLATLALLSNAIRGEAPNLISAAIDRIGAITTSTPNRREAVDGLVRGSARAVGAAIDENALMGLVQRLHIAITARPGDLDMVMQQADGAETGVYPLASAPVTVDIGGLKLTIREYSAGRPGESNVVIMLPGQVVGSFSEYLLEPMSQGTLVCARAEGEVAVAFIAGTAIAIPRAV